MIRKRLVGVVTVKSGWAVQSFGYGRYLPLGKPEVLIDNLDRWGADEILLQSIDRSFRGLGPDLPLLERIGKSGLSTPLIYAGGIRNADDAAAAVKFAADRVVVDALLRDAPSEALKIAEQLGSQALIASLPLSSTEDGIAYFDYRTRESGALAESVREALGSGLISEALVIDWRGEGTPSGFSIDVARVAADLKMPLIVFGGLSEAAQLSRVLGHSDVVAAAVGNFLSYREHAVQVYKRALAGLPLRNADFQRA